MSPTRTFWLAVLLTFLGASNTVSIKAGLAFFAPFFLGSARMAGIGLLSLAWFAAAKSPLLSASPASRRYIFICAFFKAASLVGWYAGLQATHVLRATLITMTSPILAGIISPRLIPEDKVPPLTWLSIFIGFGGTLYVLAPDWRGGGFLKGDMLILLAVATNQLLSVYQKKAMQQEVTPLQLVFWDCAVSVLVLVPLSLAAREAWRFPREPLPLLIFGYLVTVLGVFLFAFRRWMLRLTDVTYLSSFRYLEWVLTGVLALLVFSEPLPARYFFGAAAALISTWLCQRGKRLQALAATSVG